MDAEPEPDPDRSEAADTLVFINYRSNDAAAASAFLQAELSARLGNEAVFLDYESISLGRNFAPELLERVRASAVLLVMIGARWLDGEPGRRAIDNPEDWVRREIREALDHDVPVVPVLLEGTRLEAKALPPELAILPSLQHFEVRNRRLRADIGILIDSLVGHIPRLRNLSPGRETNQFEGICPYPGLATFGQHEAQWFFGRERLIEELVRNLATAMASARCMAVVGASGVGKSSLLRAGLLPAIGRGALRAPGSSAWPTLVITPTSTPVRSLVDGLAAIAGWDADAVWEQTARDPARVVDAIRALLTERADHEDRRPTRLVLVVDQFEELFTTCQDRHERDRFVAALTSACGAAEEEPAALVVLSLRSDFYAHAAEYSELRTALQEGQVLVGPMTEGELLAAVRKPAEAVGLRLEPGLVELLVRDVDIAEGALGEDAARDTALPLLAHALRQTWEHRVGQTLTVEGYGRTGGVRAALARTADDVYASLDDAGQRVVEPMLVRLVQLGDNTRDTRRRISVAALCAGLPGADRVLEAMTQARLITVDRGSAQLTHEALISAWGRLRRALEADRWRLVEIQKVDAEAERWESAVRDPSFLLRGSRLAAARDLLVEHDQVRNLTPRAKTLLNESIRQEATEAREALRRTRAVRTLLSIAAVLVLVTSTAVFYVATTRNAEQERLRVSASRQAAAKSVALRATQPGDAMLLAVAAWRISPTPEARGALLSTQSYPFAGTLPSPADDRTPVSSIAADPDHLQIAVAREHSIVVWAGLGRQPAKRAELPVDGPVTGLTFTGSGTQLIGIDRAGLRYWDGLETRPRSEPIRKLRAGSAFAVDPESGAIAVGVDDAIDVLQFDHRSVTRTLRPGAGILGRLAYLANGRTLAAVTRDDSRVILLDASTGQIRAATSGHPATITDLAVQPGGSLMATGNSDGTVQLWDTSTAALVGTLTGHGDAVTQVVFSSDGERIATASNDRTVRLWDVRTRRALSVPLTGHPDPVKAVVFVPESDALVSGGADLVVWNLRHLPVPAHSGSANAVAFSPGGRQLATVGDDGAVRLWDAVSRAPVNTLGGHAASLHAVAFNAQGTQLVTGDDDGVINVWNIAGARQQMDSALEGPPGGVRAVTFSPDGSTLAAAGGGAVLRLWEADRTTYRDLDLGPEIEGRYEISLLPDASRLTATSRDVKVDYDSHTGKRLSQAQPTNFPPSAALAVEAGDGSARATVNDDQFVRLWDSSNQLQAALYGHRDVVLDAAFSDDRHTLATVSRDGTFMIWDTNPDRVAIEVCQALGVELTPNQWDSYITDLPYQTVCG